MDNEEWAVMQGLHPVVKALVRLTSGFFGLGWLKMEDVEFTLCLHMRLSLSKAVFLPANLV